MQRIVVCCCCCFFNVVATFEVDQDHFQVEVLNPPFEDPQSLLKAFRFFFFCIKLLGSLR